jgi:hypothetical protein
MKTIGRAAIIYNIRDAYTFGALCLLIAGEIAASHVLRATSRRRK